MSSFAVVIKLDTWNLEELELDYGWSDDDNQNAEEYR